MPPVPRKVAALLGLAYVGFVAVVASRSEPVDRGRDGTIERVLDRLHGWGVPTSFDYDALEVAANVGYFVPVGLLLVLALPRSRWWVALLVGVGLSVASELGQALLLPERVSSVTDLLANSLGTVLGVGLALAARPRTSSPVAVEAPCRSREVV